MSATDAPAAPWVGQAIRRKEDPRLIMGRARYIDDINVTGQLWASFVRSPEAHAKITSIDTSGATSYPGVIAVFTGHDLDLESPLPMAWVPPGIDVNNPPHWAIAKDEVHHVGDPVALVIGSDRYAVVDAAEQVLVEYDPLPVVTDIETALDEGADLVHADLGTNKSHDWSLGGGDLDAGFAQADVIVERRVVNHRTAGAAIEPRGVLADYRSGSLILTSSTQVPHFLRLFLALQLGISEERVRAIAPEVGGGFGSKLQIYGEEIALAWASRKLERPIKWVESRSEGMLATHHGRDQVAHVKMGATKDGKITAFHVKILQDLGAYLMLLTPTIPSLGAFVMSGVYDIPAVQTDITGVFTNKMPTDAIRGAGRPEATHMIEVTIDQLAEELGMDRLELRRKNFIAADSFPHTVALGIVYDSGNYQGTLDLLLEHLDADAIKAEAPEGKLRGVGYSTYTEICGLAPSRVTGPSGFGLQTGLWESAMVRVHITGAVTVFTGTSPHGQGLETTMAQIVADRLGTDPQNVEVIHGDTGTGPQGLGTYGSRSTAVGGEAVARATAKIAEKARRIVAHQLEAAYEDIELSGGKFSVKGSPDKGMALGDVSMAAYIPENLPEGMEPGLEELAFYDPENFVFPFGAHACVVDVDPETGNVDVVKYVAIDDCGPAINPKLIDGQVHGGIVHAIGQALFERIHYNEDGQLQTGNFADYALPSAADVPSFDLDRTETASPTNSLGVKGIGEAGTIAASPAITNAVIDALRPLGVTYINMPLGSQRVWEAIQEAEELIPPEFDYVAPGSLDEAMQALADGGEDAKVLAGGHSLIPLMKLRLAAPSLLVDLRRVDELKGVSSEGDVIRFGAMTTHHAVATGNFGLVAAAAATIADQQVRNMGTIGGTLAHGDPASDMPAILLAAEGSVTIRGSSGEREVAAADFFDDYLTTAVEEGEILTSVSFPKLSGYGYGYEKFNRRQEDWAMVAVSALVKKRSDGSIEDARVGLTHMSSVPLRATAVEEALKGGASIEEASEQAAEGTEPPADLNASVDYKRHLARVLCKRALIAASQ